MAELAVIENNTQSNFKIGIEIEVHQMFPKNPMALKPKSLYSGSG